MAYADSQASGVIDYGENEAEIKLSGTVKVGDAVGWSSGWVRALATTGTAIQMRCVAGKDGASGQKIKAYFGKTFLGGSRLSGGTAFHCGLSGRSDLSDGGTGQPVDGGRG